VLGRVEMCFVVVCLRDIDTYVPIRDCHILAGWSRR